MFSTRNVILGISILLLNTGNANAALSKGYSGGQAVIYDSVSDITWMGDANLLGTLEDQFGYEYIINEIWSLNPDILTTVSSDGTKGYRSIDPRDFSPGGKASWFGAQAFISYLNSINFANSNQWALPSASGDEQYLDYNQTETQFGNLFYNELGGIAGNNIPDTDYFSNEQADTYWTNTERFQSPVNNALVFQTSDGLQDAYNKVSHIYVWPVSPGKLAAVPLPTSLLLMGSGIAYLLGNRKLMRNCWHRRVKLRIFDRN